MVALPECQNYDSNSGHQVFALTFLIVALPTFESQAESEKESIMGNYLQMGESD